MCENTDIYSKFIKKIYVRDSAAYHGIGHSAVIVSERKHYKTMLTSGAKYRYNNNVLFQFYVLALYVYVLQFTRSIILLHSLHLLINPIKYFYSRYVPTYLFNILCFEPPPRLTTHDFMDHNKFNNGVLFEFSLY